MLVDGRDIEQLRGVAFSIGHIAHDFDLSVRGSHDYYNYHKLVLLE